MKKSRYVFLFAIAAILVIFFVVLPGFRKNKLMQDLNKPAPKFSLSWLDGGQLTSGDLLGKIVVLDFWATWCGPCNQEFPEYQKLYQRYKDNPRVSLVAVNTSWNNDSVEKAKNFLQAKSYNFPAAYDEDGSVTGQFNITGIPTLIILDKSGNIRNKHVGFDQSEDFVGIISEKIDGLLAEK